MGFSHKHTVIILYVVSITLAMCGILMTAMSRGKALIFAVAAFGAILVAMLYIGSNGKHYKKK
jgi:hypothetical protein